MNKQKLKDFKLLIFDFDGVIADTDKGRFESLSEVLSGRGIDINRFCTLGDLTGISTKRFLKDKFPFLSPADVRDILTERRDIFFKKLELYCIVYPGAADTIRDLHEAGYQLALATSNDLEAMDIYLKYIGIGRFFFSILTRERIENPSSGLKDYRLVLDILNKKNTECVAIEDSPVGIAAAKDAGLCCIAFERDNDPVLTGKADYIIYDYDELRELFLL